jgi:hypothetical protein
MLENVSRAARGEKEEDVLMRGSWPLFLVRFWRFAVDEKDEVCVGVGVRCWRHCVMRLVRLMGRKARRKVERFIVSCGGGEFVGGGWCVMALSLVLVLEILDGVRDQMVILVCQDD